MAAVTVPVVHVRQAGPERIAASKVLVSAMDSAELAGESIPCKEQPDNFTSDLLAFKTPSSRLLAVTKALECLDSCPVIAQCKAFADRSFADRDGPAMYGVIAGRLVIGRHHNTLGLSARPTRPKEMSNA